MPLRVPDEDKNLTGAMETALVKGLQLKYDVFSGEQVSQKAHEIFMKENRNTAHKECDETKCMQNIAMAFQAELIATANVTKQDGVYYLALSINNIFDNKVVYSESTTCRSCDAAEIVDKLKELAGEDAKAKAEEEKDHVKTCEQLMQSSTYNLLLEQGCGFNEKVSEGLLNLYHKANCDSVITEKKHRNLVKDVLEDTQKRYKKLGKEAFCLGNESAYRDAVVELKKTDGDEISCGSQYETWVIAQMFSNACPFSDAKKQFTLKYAENTKAHCEYVLTDSLRKSIDIRVAKNMDEAFAKAKEGRTDEQAMQLWCKSGDAMIDKLEAEN
jgi:hypothetical protein